MKQKEVDQEKILNSKDIELYLDTWTEGWNKPKEMVHILETMKEAAKNSNYTFNELKKLVTLRVEEKNIKSTKEVEEEIRKKLQSEEQNKIEEARQIEAKWLSDKATLEKGFLKLKLKEDGTYYYFTEEDCNFAKVSLENADKYIKEKNEEIFEERRKSEKEQEQQEHLIKLERDRVERESYSPTSINFNHNEFYDTWQKIKGRTIKLIKQDPNNKLFFMSHIKDKVIGKAQLVQETIQKIPFVFEVEKNERDGSTTTSYKFIDDRYDARYDGYQTNVLSFEFWLYRVTSNGKEYFVFSQEKLGNEMYVFEGMKIELNNLSEVTKTLKFRSLSTIFLVYKASPFVKIISPENIIKVGKALKDDFNIGKQEVMDFLFTNPKDNKIYDFSEEYNLLQMAMLLSGKYEGYPLHIMRMGPVGTGKTTSLECLNSKFQESKGILEAGNSTPKALVPSFKEKPASPGYVLSCHRIGLIDELMKMIANASNVSRYVELMQQSLGQLNMLLEHKERTIGSGNDNTLTAKSTAKLLFATNPLPNKVNISQHVGLIDPTTLSRLIVWVQDKEEQDKVYSKNLRENKNTCSIIPSKKNSIILYDDEYMLDACGDVFINIFLSLYDSLQVFLCKYDENRVKEIFQASCNLAQEPMKQIWRSRGLHHSVLILDGIVKFRCTFQDYDPTFTAKEEDYKDLTKILIKMVNNWDSNVGPREEFNGF